MATIEGLRPVRSFQQVEGFWQVPALETSYLAVLEVERSGDHQTLWVLRLQNDRWEVVRRTANPGTRVETFDGRLVDGTIYVCTERNRSEPGQLLATDMQTFGDPRSDTATFNLLASLSLRDEQLRTVVLPLERTWSVITLFPPEAWLFGPRLVKGDIRTPVVVASTADGQVALLGPQSGGVRAAVPTIRRALEPQAAVVGEELVVAFQRPPEEEVYPFWLLPRYSGPASSVTADLIVAQGSQPELNLSALLGLGPVMRFALAPGWQGSIWLFALIDAPVGTDVVALERVHGKWTVRARQSLDRELRDISVEPGVNAGEWHLVYATATPEGSTLESQVWRIGE